MLQVTSRLIENGFREGHDVRLIWNKSWFERIKIGHLRIFQECLTIVDR